jgi:hypothetical protein
MRKKAMIGGMLLLFFLLMAKSDFAGKRPMDPMSTDSWTLNFGVGPGINYYSGYSSGFGPAFQVSFEKGTWQLGPGVLTVGGELGFSYFHYSYDDYVTAEGPNSGAKYSWLTFIFAVRSAYHYGWNVRGLDTYGGMSLGMRMLSFHATYYDPLTNGHYNPNSVYPFVGVFLGTSYFFTPAIGVNAEVGYNITPIQIGMIFKIN